MGIRAIIYRMVQAFPIIFGSSVLAIYLFRLAFGDWAVANGIYVLRRPHDIFALLVLSVLADLTHLILYSKKELSRAQMRWRHFLMLPIVLVIATPIAAMRGWMQPSSPASVAIFVGIVGVIYVVIAVVDLHTSRRLADRLNQKLKERYER